MSWYALFGLLTAIGKILVKQDCSQLRTKSHIPRHIAHALLQMIVRFSGDGRNINLPWIAVISTDSQGANSKIWRMVRSAGTSDQTLSDNNDLKKNKKNKQNTPPPPPPPPPPEPAKNDELHPNSSSPGSNQNSSVQLNVQCRSVSSHADFCRLDTQSHKIQWNLQYKPHLSSQYDYWSLRYSWSITCRRCSNYIFFLDLTPSFNGLDKDNYKTRQE